MRATDGKQGQRMSSNDLQEGSSAFSPDWLTAKEAAEYLKVGHRTVYQWAREGKIPGPRLSGCARVTWRFSRRELDAMLYKSA
jgi:excisionase family DNA binding protein